MNAQNESGNTALHMTREYDLFWCGRLLVKAGADLALTNELGNSANTGIEGEASDKDGLAALSSAHDAIEVHEALDMLDAQQRGGGVALDKAKVVLCGMGFKKKHPALWTQEVASYFRGICNAL